MKFRFPWMLTNSFWTHVTNERDIQDICVFNSSSRSAQKISELQIVGIVSRQVSLFLMFSPRQLLLITVKRHDMGLGELVVWLNVVVVPGEKNLQPRKLLRISCANKLFTVSTIVHNSNTFLNPHSVLQFLPIHLSHFLIQMVIFT